MQLKPILKWVGGKRQLLPEIKKYIPKNYNTYIEPFIGGAAVLLDIQPQKAIINDINHELINMYTVIKEHPDDLIKKLKTYNNTSDEYYEIRNKDRNENYSELTNTEKASRIIYLNKTCFNGLYRVNSKGQYNTPYGKYKNPTICDEVNIKNLSKYFNDNKIEIKNSNFDNILKLAKKGDFVYLDPPYDPLSETSSFVSYAKDGFGKKEQELLKKQCDELTKNGVKFLQSNSSTTFIKELYKDYKIVEVNAKRSISGKVEGRESVKEVLIMNY